MFTYYKTCDFRKTGLHHTLQHRPCEDHTAMRIGPGGCTAITLADGAGSYSKADTGAQITSAAAASYLAVHFDALWKMAPEDAAQHILHAVLHELAAEAAASGIDLKEYSSTLLAAAAVPDDGRYLLFHVGDGALIGLNSSGTCRVLSRYEHDGPSNLTTFVTVPDIPYFLQQGHLSESRLCGFALMSDGAEEHLVNELGCDPHVQLMLQLFCFLHKGAMQEDLEGLCHLMQSSGAGDDLSFHLLADTRFVGRMFSAVPPAFRCDVLELPAVGRQVKCLSKVLSAVALHPEGITLRQLSRALYLHSPRAAKRKAQRLVDAGLLTRSDGVLRIAE